MRYLALFIMLLTLAPSLAHAKQGTVFYVCAHPDDCVLFMNPNLYDDTELGMDKVVMLYMTSGDAGDPFNKRHSSYPYVRELGSIESTQWMADIGKDPSRLQLQVRTVDVAGHRISQARYAHTVSYFLRLPDGGPMGRGFSHYDNQSMQKLRDGEIDRITPIDAQAPYHGWQELVKVLGAIIAREASAHEPLTVHMAQPDTDINVGDHSDHVTAAHAMQEALAASHRCVQLYKHIGYAIADKPANLDDASLQNKSGSFAVLSATQYRLHGSYEWNDAHLPNLARNYYSIESLPEGCH